MMIIKITQDFNYRHRFIQHDSITCFEYHEILWNFLNLNLKADVAYSDTSKCHASIWKTKS